MYFVAKHVKQWVKCGLSRRKITSLTLTLLVILGGSAFGPPPDTLSAGRWPPPPGSPSAKLWGVVCEDLDQDGNCGLNDPPLSFVRIALLDKDGDEVDTFLTGYNGRFEFRITNYRMKKYYIVEIDPAGYDSLSPNVILWNLKDDVKEGTYAPGDTKGPYYFCEAREPEGVPEPTLKPKVLAVRAFHDFRCDGGSNAGVDHGLGGAQVTLVYNDGTQVTKETTSQGYAYFTNLTLPNDDASATVSIEWPAEEDGSLVSCTDSRDSIRLTAQDFSFDARFVEFRADNTQ